jgi:hypothetical protein
VAEEEEEEEQEERYVSAYPNRHRAESKATRSAVLLLLLVSAVLTAIVAIAGVPIAASPGMQFLGFLYILLFLVMAYFIFKWSRGVLAMAAAFAVLFALLSIVAAPAWFAHDKPGFTPPLLPAPVIGLITIVLVPVQLILVAFSMRGFNQGWNIEVPVPEHEANENLADKYDEGGRRIEHDDEDEEGEERS